MTIRLSDRFSYKRLLRFTCPAIAMMLFTSIRSEEHTSELQSR